MTNRRKMFSIPVVKYASFSDQARTLKIKPSRFNIKFSKNYFKTGTICLLFYFHMYLWFGILLWKIVKKNISKTINQKIFRKYNPIRHYFVMSRKWLSCPFANEVYDNYNKVSYLQESKNAITWKPLFKRKSTFLSKLDLSIAITWQLFKSLSLRL